MGVLVWEDGTADDQVVVHAEIHKALGIVISFTTSVLAHCPLVVRIVSSHFGIHVASYKHNVVLAYLRNHHLQLFVAVFFDLLLSLVGWCIAL